MTPPPSGLREDLVNLHAQALRDAGWDYEKFHKAHDALGADPKCRLIELREVYVRYDLGDGEDSDTEALIRQYAASLRTRAVVMGVINQRFRRAQSLSRYIDAPPPSPEAPTAKPRRSLWRWLLP